MKAGELGDVVGERYDWIMRALILLTVIFVFGCGDSQDLGDVDASYPLEDAEVIGDDDPEDPSLPGDDDDDDEEEEPEPSKPWRYYRDGDECDLVSQNCPFEDQTCVRPRLGDYGLATCVADWGTRDENSYEGCDRHEDGSTNCRRGMVCTDHRACRFPCDPNGAACPDTKYGTPQSCVDHVSYPQPTCHW